MRDKIQTIGPSDHTAGAAPGCLPAVILLCCVSILMIPGPLSAQTGGGDLLERQFRAGLNAFQSGHYADASSIFGEIADTPGLHARSPAANIMAAKALYRAGDIPAARSRANRFLERYPSSAYCDEALYILALCEFRKGHFDIAASYLTTLISDYPLSETIPSCRKLFSEIVASRLPLSELKRLARIRLPAGLHTVTSVSLARALSRRDEDSLAVAILDGLLSDPDAVSSRDDVLALRDEIASGEKIAIGVLLPLMMDQPGSDVGRLASEVLDGIRFALDRYNSGTKSEKQVEIEVRDTGRDTAIASAI